MCHSCHHCRLFTVWATREPQSQYSKNKCFLVCLFVFYYNIIIVKDIVLLWVPKETTKILNNQLIFSNNLIKFSCLNLGHNCFPNNYIAMLGKFNKVVIDMKTILPDCMCLFWYIFYQGHQLFLWVWMINRFGLNCEWTNYISSNLRIIHFSLTKRQFKN